MTYRLPPLSTLRVFEAAARHLSFKRSAAELHVTPSAVSQQIKKLESHLGIPLFERRADGVALSDSGELLMRHVRDGLACFSAGIDAVRQSRGGVQAQTLTISAPPNFATRWLAHHMSGFSSAHPEIDISIVSKPDHIDGGRGESAPSLTASDPSSLEYEVAIRLGNGIYPGYFVERLLVPEYVLVCSPQLVASKTPLRSLEDLRGQVFIHDEAIREVDKRPSWREWLQLAGVHGVDPSHGPRYSNAALVHEAVLAGQGVALVIRQQIESDVAAGRLVVPFPISLPSAYAYYLVVAESDVQQPFVRDFMIWIRREIAAQGEVV